MHTWVYFAAPALANNADTIGFAKRENLLWRSARNSLGRLIPRVGDLRPGDTILLVYRQGRPHVARVAAKIAKPAHPVLGTAVIERIEPPHSQYLLDAGYRHVNDGGAVEVIHLEDVIECELYLQGTYGGNNTIHQLAPEDVNSVASLSSTRYSTNLDVHSPPPDNPPAVVSVQGPPHSAPIGPPTELATDDPEVAAIRRLDTARRPLFDAYVMVDWSSSSVPVHGADSIWIAWGSWEGGELIEDHANAVTRSAALRLLREKLLGGIFAGRRILLGFDFAFGYPRGFASALGLAGPPWKAVHDELGERVKDDLNGLDNRHNRDQFATQCNTRIAGGGPGPFWGCHNGAAGRDLTTRRVGVFAFPYAGLNEFRETERRARMLGIQPQSVWKLNQGVSVGGQTILGIKYLNALRFIGHEEPDDRMSIWPFETGWAVPPGADQAVVAEIFPSVLPIEDDLSGLVRDLAQVRTCVRHAAALDARGRLEGAFGPPPGLSEAQLAAASEEEGWILFVP